jgi:prepilin-type N-terminal cleavage/methylation domain-containing protein
MPKALKRGGFTLFELLIVVTLIGIVYAVFVAKMSQKNARTTPNVTIADLAESLRAMSYRERADLYCLENESTCRLYLDGEPIEKGIKLFKKPPKVWVYDRYGALVPKRFLPAVIGQTVLKKIVFHYFTDRGGGSSNFIVETDGHAYLFAPLTPTAMFDRLDAAAKTLAAADWLPTERSIYE